MVLKKKDIEKYFKEYQVLEQSNYDNRNLDDLMVDLDKYYDYYSFIERDLSEKNDDSNLFLMLNLGIIQHLLRECSAYFESYIVNGNINQNDSLAKLSSQIYKDNKNDNFVSPTETANILSYKINDPLLSNINEDLGLIGIKNYSYLQDHKNEFKLFKLICKLYYQYMIKRDMNSWAKINAKNLMETMGVSKTHIYRLLNNLLNEKLIEKQFDLNYNKNIYYPTKDGFKLYYIIE